MAIVLVALGDRKQLAEWQIANRWTYALSPPHH